MHVLRTRRLAVMHWRRRTQLAAAVLIVVALLVVGAGIYYAHRSNATTYLVPNVASGWSVFSGALHPGDIFDVGIESGSVPSSDTIMLRPVTLPLGLPAHVRLVGEVLLLGGLGASKGWPPGRGDTPPGNFRYYRLDGYKARPGLPFIIGLGLQADVAGAFLVGPVTVHAEVPLVGSSGPSIPIQVTYSQYASLCVQVPMDTCHQWTEEQISAIEAGTLQHAPGIIYRSTSE
jgi:hypothetical protein